MRKIKALLVICVTFVVFFFLATAITDTMARMNGFYAEGEAASLAIERGEY